MVIMPSVCTPICVLLVTIQFAAVTLPPAWAYMPTTLSSNVQLTIRRPWSRRSRATPRSVPVKRLLESLFGRLDSVHAVVRALADSAVGKGHGAPGIENRRRGNAGLPAPLP